MILYPLLEDQEFSSSSIWIEEITGFHNTVSDKNYTSQINTIPTTEQQPFYYFNIGNNNTINKNIFTSNAEKTGNVNNTFKRVEEINLRETLNYILDKAKEEEFEDGIESIFSRSLISLINRFGKNIIEIITPIFLNEGKNPEIISEALRWLGKMSHSQTYFERLWLLEKCLFSNSPYIRDGALLGLSSMNDISSIYSLEIAAEREKIQQLKEDIEQII